MNQRQGSKRHFQVEELERRIALSTFSSLVHQAEAVERRAEATAVGLVNSAARLDAGPRWPPWASSTAPPGSSAGPRRPPWAS